MQAYIESPIWFGSTRCKLLTFLNQSQSICGLTILSLAMYAIYSWTGTGYKKISHNVLLHCQLKFQYGVHSDCQWEILHLPVIHHGSNVVWTGAVYACVSRAVVCTHWWRTTGRTMHQVSCRPASNPPPAHINLLSVSTTLSQFIISSFLFSVLFCSSRHHHRHRRMSSGMLHSAHLLTYLISSCFYI